MNRPLPGQYYKFEYMDIKQYYIGRVIKVRDDLENGYFVDLIGVWSSSHDTIGIQITYKQLPFELYFKQLHYWELKEEFDNE